MVTRTVVIMAAVALTTALLAVFTSLAALARWLHGYAAMFVVLGLAAAVAAAVAVTTAPQHGATTDGETALRTRR